MMEKTTSSDDGGGLETVNGGFASSTGKLKLPIQEQHWNVRGLFPSG